LRVFLLAMSIVYTGIMLYKLITIKYAV
jgi:hypothetical protein